jgi:hypothetical protein
VRFIGPRTPATKRAFARDARAGEVHLRDDVLEAVVGLGNRRRVEGVRLEDVRARLEVLHVDLADHLGTRKAEEVVVPAQVLREVLEPLAAILRLGQPIALDHRAHGAVEHEDALLQRVMQRGDAI